MFIFELTKEVKKMETMPKTINEQLDEIEPDGSILISEDSRPSWATKISKHYRGSGKRFKIRQKKVGEVVELRVWRVR